MQYKIILFYKIDLDKNPFGIEDIIQFNMIHES